MFPIRRIGKMGKIGIRFKFVDEAEFFFFNQKVNERTGMPSIPQK